MISLLILIYATFISLGLQDSLLGSAWPAMYADLGVPIGSMGIITMTASGSVVVSALLSNRIIKRFGTVSVVIASVCMTSFALMGFSLSTHFIMICAFAILLGMGGGLIDASLNNFVAVHYQAKYMNWLHCFWGVGALSGPIIMSYSLIWFTWNVGYRMVSIAQLLLIVSLIFSIPFWKKMQNNTGKNKEDDQEIVPIAELIKLPGAKQACITFFLYCSVEMTVGLWGSSYLVTVRGMPAEVAARFVALYFFGITLGRVISGFVVSTLTNKNMIQLGQLTMVFGIVILILPVEGNFLMASFFLIGLGCAPIFPSLIHETPVNFGSKHSQGMIGLQMAFAYTGNTFGPPLFGFLGARVGFGLLPLYAGVILLFMVFVVVSMYSKTRKMV